MVGKNELRRRAPGPRPRPRRQRWAQRASPRHCGHRSPVNRASGNSPFLFPVPTRGLEVERAAPRGQNRNQRGQRCRRAARRVRSGGARGPTASHSPRRGSQTPARSAGFLPTGSGRCAPPRSPNPRGRLRTPPRPYFGGSRKHEGRNAGPAGRAGGSAPRPPAEASPSLPFWERIASPVLRSPNTDSGPSIFAAGHTSGCTYTADSWRRFLGPAAATPAAAATQRGPGPAMPQGMLGTPLHLLPRPPGPFSACAAAGQGGKERRGGERRVNVQEVRSRKGGLITFAQLESE